MRASPSPQTATAPPPRPAAALQGRSRLQGPLTTAVGAFAGVALHVLLTVAAGLPGKMALALSVFALALAYIQLGDGARKLQRGVTGWEQHKAHKRASGKTSNRVRRAEPAAIP